MVFKGLDGDAVAIDADDLSDKDARAIFNSDAIAKADECPQTSDAQMCGKNFGDNAANAHNAILMQILPHHLAQPREAVAGGETIRSRQGY